MNLLSKSILVAALGMATATVASATQYIYVTGSTAARDAVYNTLTNTTTGFFDNTGTAQPTFHGIGSSTPGNCSYMAFSNNVSGTPTIIKCTWSGSEAGIADVSSTTKVEVFIVDADLTGAPGTTTIVNSGTPTTSDTNTTSTVDLAMADNAISFSKIPTSTASQTAVKVAIPFVFVKNHTTLADQAAFTNLTVDGFKALASGGDTMSLFTGNKADNGYYVYLAGRDNNSGTRVNVLGETGWGITKAVNQIELSGGNMVDSAPPSGVYQANWGQSSGGTLAKSLVDTTSSIDQVNTGTAGFVVVAYLGLADENTATNTTYNCTQLTYDGVACTPAAIENGTYSIWGKEYIVEKASESSLVTTLKSDIATHLGSNTTGYEIPYSSMNVDRTGPVTPPFTGVPTN